MIKDLKLFSRNKATNTNDFEFSNMDIEFDNRGFFVRCENSDEGLNQNFLKAVATSVQDDGYGTNLFKLLGKQNLTFIKVKLMQEILNSIFTLRENQINEYNKYNGNYDNGMILNRIANLYFKDITNTSIYIDAKAQSLKKDLENSLDLHEINLTI